MECSHGLACKVTLHLGPAEQEETDIRVGDDVGDDLLETEVLGLAGPADSGSLVADPLLIEVGTAGHNGDRAVGIARMEVSLDDRPPACR